MDTSDQVRAILAQGKGDDSTGDEDRGCRTLENVGNAAESGDVGSGIEGCEMKKILYAGSPKPTTQHIGTRNQPNDHRDRWGMMCSGSIRVCRVALEDCRGEYVGQIDIPLSWFGQKTKMKMKIVAEIER